MKTKRNPPAFLLFSFIICILFQPASADGPAVQWEKTFGGSSLDVGLSVQQTSDGGFIIAGVYPILWCSQMTNVYLVKTDPNGNLLWQKTFGGSSDDYGHSVQQTSDGGFIIARLYRVLWRRGLRCLSYKDRFYRKSNLAKDLRRKQFGLMAIRFSRHLMVDT